MSTLVRVARLGGERRGRLLLGLTLGVAASLSSVALLGTSAWLISRAAQHPPVVALSVAIVGVRAFAVGRSTFRYGERLASHDAMLRVLSDLRVAVYRRLEVLAPVGLRAFGDGDLLSRLVADVDGVGDAFVRGMLPYASAVMAGLAVGAVCVVLLPAAGAVLLVGLLTCAVVVPWGSARLASRAERGVVAARTELAEQVVDLLDGTDELVAYGAAAARLDSLAAADRGLTAQLGRSAWWVGAGTAGSVLVGGLTVWATLALAVPAVRSGRLPVVLLAVLALLPLALSEVLGTLAPAAAGLHRSAAGARRVFAVLDAPDPTRQPAAPLALPAGPYDLRVSGLRAGWGPDAPDVVAGLDLDLPAGRRVAVVGPSGSGKTTLAMVLLRFLDRSAGTVTLAGTDIAELDQDAVRRLVGLLAQDAHTFDTTVFENVRLARPTATADEVRAALRRARLLVWVDSLPDGLDTRVGEHGERLSGGQRQRLALARVVLADFPIVILDEPGEHLDVATADALTADLLEVTRDRTTVLITHRLAGLDAVDEVLVMSSGHVVQRGTHSQLVAVDGFYREQWLREGGASGATGSPGGPR
jgi:thiol reductant ABC exporter CydC subunit